MTPADARDRSTASGLTWRAASWVFCVLAANFAARSVRDAIAVQSDDETTRRLFIGTLIATLLLNPPLAFFLARANRRLTITLLYRFFSGTLVATYVAMLVTGGERVEWIGWFYYIALSVFNVAMVSLFWAFMADVSSLVDSKQRYGRIAMGATLGAIAGGSLASGVSWLAKAGQIPAAVGGALVLIPIAALLIEIAVQIMRTLDRRVPPRDAHGRVVEQRIKASWYDGFLATIRSIYLSGLSLYLVCLAMISTLMYFTKIRIVREASEGLDESAFWLANIDIAQNVAVLLVQAFATGWLLRRLGVSLALAVLPLTALAGFAALALQPAYTVYVVFEAVFKAVKYAVQRPARETLFTVVSREEKYAAKALLDTFVYRGGDVFGTAVQANAERMAASAAFTATSAMLTLAAPITLVAGTVGVWLGYRQRVLAARTAGPADPAPDSDRSDHS